MRFIFDLCQSEWTKSVYSCHVRRLSVLLILDFANSGRNLTGQSKQIMANDRPDIPGSPDRPDIYLSAEPGTPYPEPAVSLVAAMPRFVNSTWTTAAL